MTLLLQIFMTCIILGAHHMLINESEKYEPLLRIASRVCFVIAAISGIWWVWS